jgi:hypothetical protein
LFKEDLQGNKKEKFRNDTIRGSVDVGKNILEVIEEEG